MELLAMIFLVLSVLTPAHSDYIQASDGGFVECIDKRKQTAFDHALLKYHKIQEWPSEIPTTMGANKKTKWHTREARVSTAECPEGTIPVRKDYPYSSNTSDVPDQHEHAIVSTENSPKLYGTKAKLNVWDPKIEKGADELSISQIWISSGSYEDNNLNTIEVGWQVYPSFYQDNKPRLFIYWTSDTYSTTGCYNLECPGFIQTSSSIVLGGVITPTSVVGGNQFEITISVWKDKNHGNWWLSLGSKSNMSLVGYWPGEIFGSLADYADEVQWGGEITDLHSSGRHTTTQMGSGHSPVEGFGKASYIRNLEIVDNKNRLQPVPDLYVKLDNPKFYNVKKLFRDDLGTYIFFGGPIASGVAPLLLSWFCFYFSFISFLVI